MTFTTKEKDIISGFYLWTYSIGIVPARSFRDRSIESSVVGSSFDNHELVDHLAELAGGSLLDLNVSSVEHLEVGDAVVGYSLGTPWLWIVHEWIDDLGTALY